MLERRRFERFRSAIDVEYEVPQCSIEGVSLTKDISISGISLPTSMKIDEGEKLELRIKLPRDSNPIYATAQVVWSQPAQTQADFDLGLKFVKINDIDKSRILEYIYNEWLKDKRSNIFVR